VGALLTPIVLVVGIALAATGAGALTRTSATTVCTGGVDTATTDAAAQLDDLSPTQLDNARIIHTVSTQLGLPARAAVIAIATAMQESTLRNLNVATDHDSLGLFQQRPSQGWGSPTQLLDPVYAATAFYHRLVRIPDWQTQPLTEVAQAIQRSAYPDAYAKWEPLATALAGSFGDAAGTCIIDNGIDIPGDVAGSLPAGFAFPPGTPPQVVVAASWALRQLGTPYRFGGSCTDPHGTDPAKRCDCSSLMQQAYKAAGITLPRVTTDQVHAGIPVPSANLLRPGDLIFLPGSLGSKTNPRHVGMYLGSGLVVHAPKTGDVVKISRLQGYWLANVAAIRRVVN
jgi:cell wall-associated NlpC family hydrolase